MTWYRLDRRMGFLIALCAALGMLALAQLGASAIAAGPPTATTGSAVSIRHTSATVRGRVNPKGSSTTHYFEFGVTAAYGNKTPSKTLSAGKRTRTVSAGLTGLQPGQTYHYRVVATNANGTALGNDRIFP